MESEKMKNDLIQLRIDSYIKFMKKIKVFSGIGKKSQLAISIIEDNVNTFQDAIYGEIGMLSSHETRQLLLSSRKFVKYFLENKSAKINEKKLELFNKTIWTLHFSLRIDIGIYQPLWDLTLKEVLKEDCLNNSNIDAFVDKYPWKKFDYR